MCIHAYIHTYVMFNIYLIGVERKIFPLIKVVCIVLYIQNKKCTEQIISILCENTLTFWNYLSYNSFPITCNWISQSLSLTQQRGNFQRYQSNPVAAHDRISVSQEQKHSSYLNRLPVTDFESNYLTQQKPNSALFLFSISNSECESDSHQKCDRNRRKRNRFTYSFTAAEAVNILKNSARRFPLFHSPCSITSFRGVLHQTTFTGTLRNLNVYISF